ncbi:MAG: hypothetical protein GX075_09515 [Firmicutes bacterium]|nr:hypothetical protein [Bacillota bacterium]
MALPSKIETWQMIAPGKMERVAIDVPELKPFIRTMPMSRIKEAYETARRGGLTQRIVLIPDF